MGKPKNNIGVYISTIIILSIIVISMINYVFVAKDVITNVSISPVSSVNITSNSEENSSTISKLEKQVDKVLEFASSKADEILLRDFFINLNTQIDLLLGERLITDSEKTVGLLDNGYLAFVTEKPESSVDDQLNFMFDLQEKISKSNPDTDMLYVQAPCKISKFDPQMPDYEPANINKLLDWFLSGIEGKVDYIDLRQNMYDQGINQYDYFFKTDHHWTPKGAFWATNEISKTLERNYGFETNYDYLNLDNYKIDVYKDVFLGSEGKIVGDGLTGKDDLSLIYPKFETDFTFEIRGYNIIKNGTFEETIFDYDYLHIHDGKDMVYLGGHHANAIIKNNNVNNGKKILIVKDSFVNVVAPYLVLNYEQIDLIDLRMYDRMTIDEYVKATNPDLVMFLYTETPLAGFD